MHICYVTGEYPIKNLSHGGVGTFTRSIGYKLVENGISVSVIRIAPVQKTELIIDNGVNVYLIPEVKKIPFKFIWNSFKINKKIKEIHIKNPISIIETPELGLAFLKKIKGIKYCIRMHGGHHFFAKAENRTREWKKVWQEKHSFKKADSIIAVSQYVADATKELMNLDSREIEIIHNPIDTARFYQSDSSKIEKHTVFFGGTIIEKKGIRQLVQSLEYLVDDFPDIKLIIAGRDATIPGTNQLYRPILDAVISKKIKPHIEFLGIISNFDMPIYIEKSHLCCYPSHMEAMPIAWLEVLAMGKVFIGSNLGPGPEVIKDKETGFLVDPFDPKEIASKIKYIFENDSESIKIGTNAREMVGRDFDINTLILKNIKFYKSIL